MFEIVAEIVKRGQAEELRKIIKQYELNVSKDVSKRKENKKNDRIWKHYKRRIWKNEGGTKWKKIKQKE